VVEDAVGELAVGIGQFIGDLGLATIANARSTAVEPTKVLVLSSRDVENLWTTSGSVFLAAAIQSLYARWR